MDILEDRYLIFARKLLSFFGIWYTQTFRKRIIRNYIVSFILSHTVFSQLCQLFSMDFNLLSIVMLLQTFIPVVSTMSIYLVFTLHFTTVKQIFVCVVQDCQQLKDETELKIMQKYINESKLFVVVCASLFYIFLSFALFPFIRQIIISISGVINDRYHGTILVCFNYFTEKEYFYYPLLLYIILAGVFLTTIAMVCYSLYFWFIQHTCAHLSIIKSKIRQLFENEQHNGNVDKKPLDLSDKTIDIIQRLSRTRDFMTMVNTLGERCYLFQMTLAFLLVLLNFLCLFQIPVLLPHKEAKKDVIAFVVFILYTIIPLYLNCFVGQRLINYSVDVYEEMCLIPIHDITLKSQKLLLITIMMNAKPCAISIGKMFVSSHKFFSDLLRMAFSFAMTLHSTQHA